MKTGEEIDRIKILVVEDQTIVALNIKNKLKNPRNDEQIKP